MEPIGAFPEGEWDSYSRIFSMEEPDFAAEVLGQCSFPSDNSEGSQATYPSTVYRNPETMVEANGSLLHFGNAISPSLNSLSDHTNLTDHRVLITTPSSCQEYFWGEFNCASSDLSMTMDFSIMDEKATSSLFSQLLADIPMGDSSTYTIDHPLGNDKLASSDHNQQDISCGVQLKRKLNDSEPKASQLNQAKKRPRVASEVEKKKKNVKSRKNSKLTPPPGGTDEDHQEANAGALDRQSLSNYSSEDENGSQDSNGGASSESKASHGALNSSGKTRATRGSATDPQSLYARKRRERINERLRILQNLVPNGTKVDISTMLEEAVHYVKFLQLQIKLLSSDDLWMFAPIAYNGIDIGLNQKLSMLL